MTGSTIRNSILAAAVLGAVVGLVVAAGGWHVASTTQPTEGPAAGEQATGALLVHQASFEGSHTERAFRSAFQSADGPDEKAAVAGRYLDRGHDRLAELRERRTTLQRARENGSLSTSAYRARAGQIREAAGSLQRLASSIEGAAEGLPDDARERHGVSADRIAGLQRDAAALERSVEETAVTPAFGPGFYAEFREMVSRYNENVASAGDGAPDLLAGEEVTLVVEDGSAQTVLSFRVAEDGTIRDVRAGAREDATVRLLTGRETMAEITAADDPATALQRAIERGAVEIEGVGPKNRVKWAILRELARL